MGAGTKDCVVTLVESKTGLVLIVKLADRTAESLRRRVASIIGQHAERFATMTADNVLPTKASQRLGRSSPAQDSSC